MPIILQLFSFTFQLPSILENGGRKCIIKPREWRGKGGNIPKRPGLFASNVTRIELNIHGQGH